MQIMSVALDCNNGVLRTPKPTAVNDSAAAMPSAAASTWTAGDLLFTRADWMGGHTSVYV
jgi:hypothetical protein